MRIANVGRPRLLATLVALIASPIAEADEPKPKPRPQPHPKAVENRVELDLRISGLTKGEGWSLEIKPAHAGSRFEKVVREVDTPRGGLVRLDAIAIDARSLGADRDCAFAITITGPDGDSQTFKRSIRLQRPEADKPVPVVSKTYYLRSTVIARKDDPGDRPG